MLVKHFQIISNFTDKGQRLHSKTKTFTLVPNKKEDSQYASSNFVTTQPSFHGLYFENKYMSRSEPSPYHLYRVSQKNAMNTNAEKQSGRMETNRDIAACPCECHCSNNKKVALSYSTILHQHLFCNPKIIDCAMM